MSAEKKRRSKMSRLIKRVFFRVLLIAIVIAALGTGFLWAKNLILARQVQVIAAMEGSLDVALETEAWLVNTETVITSGMEGKLEKTVQEGERVRKGSIVARVNSQVRGTKVDLTGPISGVVSYNVDGLEGVLTPKNLIEWDLEKFEGLKPASPAGELVQGGQGVFKLVDNLLPTYVLFKLPKQGVALALGEKVNLALGEQKLSGKVIKISKQGPEAGLAVALSSFLPQSLGQRQIKIGWLDKNPVKGVIIPAPALQQRQGNTGVFVLRDGVVTWQGVEVLAQSPDKICVKGLKAGEALITTPGYVREGQVITTGY